MKNIQVKEYQFDGFKIRIMKGNNMDLLRQTDILHYDLAIVDPPYGIDAGKMTMGKGSGNDTKKHNTKNWDKNVPDEKYFIMLRKVSKNQIIWGGNYFLDYLRSTKCMVVWDKKDYNSDFADGEIAWTSLDKSVKILQRARGKNKENIGKIHPTQKPVYLYRWLIDNFVDNKKGFKILDTHGGSMSIAIACWQEGISLDVIEKDEEYFNLAVERFEKTIRTPKLNL